MKVISLFILGIIVFTSCTGDENTSDAYGNFISTEITISAETAGKIMAKICEEGKLINAGDLTFVIDTLQPALQSKELQAHRIAVIAKRANVQAQIAVLEEQKKSLTTDQKRIKNMLFDGAASQKQLDDLQNNLLLLDKQIDQVKTNFTAIGAEVSGIDASLAQVVDLIRRAKVVAPVKGTILATYAELGETVTPGKPLFKLSDLSSMELKAYFSGNQLAQIQIGETVNVLVDDGKGGQVNYSGTINWIASSAEFTPKIIQTREERVSLVYAVKIKVENDGFIKINMPGEVKLKAE